MTPDIARAEDRLRDVFAADEAREGRIYARLHEAFGMARLAESDLVPHLGYAFHNPSLARLEEVFRAYFGTEAALMRPQLVSGTHALSLALEAFCEPGTTLLTIPGKPYDTLDAVIGWSGSEPGSLATRGVRAIAAGVEDLPGVLGDLRPDVVLIQRSRGYARRPALSVADIGGIVRSLSGAGALIIVDNCYGEFVEEGEPSDVGADLVIGSLIKNPGGALAPAGAYAVGRREAVERIARRLFGPALGSAPGPVPEGLRAYVQGLALAPHFVSQALQTTRLAAEVFDNLGYEVEPRAREARSDIVVRIGLGDRERLERAVAALQGTYPVDAHLKPEGAPLPGYREDVLMASSSFVPGGTLDLSADAPMRPPWDLFLQGGLSRPAAHGALAAMAEAVGARLGARQPE